MSTDGPAPRLPRRRQLRQSSAAPLVGPDPGAGPGRAGPPSISGPGSQTWPTPLTEPVVFPTGAAPLAGHRPRARHSDPYRPDLLQYRPEPDQPGPVQPTPPRPGPAPTDVHRPDDVLPPAPMPPTGPPPQERRADPSPPAPAPTGRAARRRTLSSAPVTFDLPEEVTEGGGAQDTPGSGPRQGDGAGAPSEPTRRVRRVQAQPSAAGSRRFGRAGRDLPAAIGVGLVLAAAVLGSLLYRKEIFVGLVCAAVVLAVWELVGAFAARKIQAPVIPLVVGSIGMLISAYVARAEGLLVAFATTAFGVLMWRLVDGLSGAVRDISAGVFTAAYVPFLAGFAIIMLAEPDGAMRVLVYIAATVASDIGGYAAGVLFGRHPLAPSVSPKKSWEGFAGSVLVSMFAASIGVVVLLDGPWWAGPAIGAATAVTATLGDLSESLIKRDLGVKDMSSVLPGHGGMMDRLDSLLLTAPAAFVLLAVLVEPAV